MAVRMERQPELTHRWGQIAPGTIQAGRIPRRQCRKSPYVPKARGGPKAAPTAPFNAAKVVDDSYFGPSNWGRRTTIVNANDHPQLCRSSATGDPRRARWQRLGQN